MPPADPADLEKVGLAKGQLGTMELETALLHVNEAVVLVEQINMSTNTAMAGKCLGRLSLDMDKAKLLECLRRAGHPRETSTDKPSCVLFVNKIPAATADKLEELAKVKHGTALREKYADDHPRLFREMADLAASTLPTSCSMDITDAPGIIVVVLWNGVNEELALPLGSLEQWAINNVSRAPEERCISFDKEFAALSLKGDFAMCRSPYRAPGELKTGGTIKGSKGIFKGLYYGNVAGSDVHGCFLKQTVKAHVAMGSNVTAFRNATPPPTPPTPPPRLQE